MIVWQIKIGLDLVIMYKESFVSLETLNNFVKEQLAGNIKSSTQISPAKKLIQIRN